MTENNDEVDYSCYFYENRHQSDKKDNEKDDREVDYEIVDEDIIIDRPVINEYSENTDIIDRQDSVPAVIRSSDVSVVRDNDCREPRAVYTISKGISRIEFQEKCDNCNGNNIQNTKMPHKRRRFGLAVALVLICFTLTILVADLLSNGYVTNKVSGVFKGKGNETTYYAVELASFTDMNSARVLSSEVRDSGAGGYVINDELYRVIAEVYPTKNDALSVSAKLNLNGYVTGIYTIRIGEVDYSLFPLSTRNITKDVMGYADKLYKEFYQLALDMDNGKTDFSGAKTAVNNINSELKGLLIDYKSNCEDHLDDESVVKVVSQLNALIGAVGNINTESDNLRDMVSDIRYVNAMILNTHRALTKSLSRDSKQDK